MVNVDGTNAAELATASENASGFSTLRPELPTLPYSIRDHARNVIFIWTLFTLDTAVFPLLLFYVLWYRSSESPTHILTITTCVFGLFASIEWALRTLRLWKREDVRPIGGQRKGVRVPISQLVSQLFTSTTYHDEAPADNKIPVGFLPLQLQHRLRHWYRQCSSSLARMTKS